MVVDNQQYCLRWNNHQSTLISVLDSLLENAILVDCTLAAEGKYLKAHKVVLCACSPYLQSLLSEHNEKHPIIILKDVKFTELKAMMDYMYRGEVNISEDQLGPFLKTAESLQIKGLSDNAGGSCATGNNSGAFGTTADHAVKSTTSQSQKKLDVQPKRTIYGMLFQPKSPTPTPVTNLSNLTIEPSHKVIVSNSSVTNYSTCGASVENYELAGETSPNIKRRKLIVRSPKLVIDTEMAQQELVPSSVSVPVIINPDSADRGVPVMPISQAATISQSDAQVATIPSYTSELFEYGQQLDSKSPLNQYDSKSEGGYNDVGGDDNDNGLDYAADDDEDMEGYESSVGNVGDADTNMGLSSWQLSEQSDDSAYLPTNATSTPSSQDPSWAEYQRRKMLAEYLLYQQSTSTAWSEDENRFGHFAGLQPHHLDPSSVRKHRDRSKQESRWECPVCGKRYKYSRGLAMHRRLECGKEPMFHCPYCPQKCHQKGNMVIHIKKKHPTANNVMLDIMPENSKAKSEESASSSPQGDAQVEATSVTTEDVKPNITAPTSC